MTRRRHRIARAANGRDHFDKGPRAELEEKPCTSCGEPAFLNSRALCRDCEIETLVEESTCPRCGTFVMRREYSTSAHAGTFACPWWAA